METRANTTQTWRFGVFEVDASTMELRRGGTPVKLREQSFNILVFLLAHSNGKRGYDKEGGFGVGRVFRSLEDDPAVVWREVWLIERVGRSGSTRH